MKETISPGEQRVNFSATALLNAIVMHQKSCLAWAISSIFSSSSSRDCISQDRFYFQLEESHFVFGAYIEVEQPGFFF